MKRTIRRALALLLSLALIPGLLPLLAGCQKNVPAEEEETTNDNLLTNIYDRVSGGDSTGMLNTGVRPRWDGEANTLTYVTTEYKEEGPSGEDPEDGDDLVRYSVSSLVTLSEDGTSVQREILDDREGYRLGCGSIDADGITCAVYASDGGNTRILLSRYDFAAESWTYGEDISALFAQKPVSLSGFRADGDGDLCAASDREVLILTPDGKKKGSVFPDISSGGQISGLYAS
ncbi:MAG: hypothetical protein IIU08_10175, partial [Clostridia bacterium]|nr:hypothetical protein [Clostridia bacterium]